jgi:hypothetical protein
VEQGLGHAIALKFHTANRNGFWCHHPPATAFKQWPTELAGFRGEPIDAMATRVLFHLRQKLRGMALTRR